MANQTLLDDYRALNSTHWLITRNRDRLQFFYESYVGGELEFDPRNNTDPKVSTVFTSPDFKEQGTLVVFPSFIYHRVRPVTKGTRYSLVMWSCGEKFK
jgi:predicted 2-oxoglutarate/Fe(II)-dependent dioxygenase YbiX